MRTVGIEEEYLLIGPDGVPVAVAGDAIEAAADQDPGGDDEPGGDVEVELKQQQVETGTHPRTSLTDLAQEIRDGRRRADQAAVAAGARIAALATSPLAVDSTIMPKPRYRKVEREFGLTSREQLTCGCHVHVAVEDAEEGVAVLDRLGPWLPVLLALSTNSPFWQGEDSGYASFRAQVWNRWPTAGPVAPFGSALAYRDTVDALLATGTILDVGMVYFDARLSARYPTLEVRVPDVCLDPDDATLLGALVRGLVETASREASEGIGPRVLRAEPLRAASWRASRSGLSDDLVSPMTMRPVPARVAVDELVDHVRVALEDAGDLEAVRDLVARVLERGTGAELQRRWLGETGDLALVVKRAVETTMG
ncbi:MAG: carboxylate--amine ligase [Actinotalea sp.]|nr:carboxylate--amine ligase [Actinotalea sp.]